MLDHSRRSGVLRTNQAVPSADSIRRPSGTEMRRGFTGAHPGSAFPVALAERPGILRRMARAAQDAVREARDSGDVPLPHLYRGRDFQKTEKARAA